MAEATAMALAAIITRRLNLQLIIFLSDNQQLVHFLNAPDQTNPPEWRIKRFTQMFTNFTGQRHARILRIQRTQNQTADVLARQAFLESQPTDELPRQAFLESQPTSSNMACTCTNIAHVTQCPIQEALLSVALNSVRLLSTACC